MVSRPETGSDPSIGSGRDSGCDNLCRLKQEMVFHTSSRLLMTIQDMVMYTY